MVQYKFLKNNFLDFSGNLFLNVLILLFTDGREYFDVIIHSNKHSFGALNSSVF